MRRLLPILVVTLIFIPTLWAQDSNVATTPIANKFKPPKGFTRYAADSSSFATFLRKLPIRDDRKTVHSYKGNALNSPSAGVVLLSVGKRDLQQCADSIIRLHAEWKWQNKDADDLAYHFTSGDRSSWKDWKNGERFVVKGSKVKRVRNGKKDGSQKNFRKYLFHMFRYAGTRSLKYDSGETMISYVLPGDFFVAPGSPGHAVMVLDVVENEKGERLMLLGQGFMPAQEFHVIRDSGTHVVDGVWFKVPTHPGKISTPSWNPFSTQDLRRFNDL